MHIDATHVRELRERHAWTQEDLAREAGLDARTIQRIERSGSASLRSQRAIAAALDIEPNDLTTPQEHRMSPCPECRSTDVYASVDVVDTTTIGGELLPKLSSRAFSSTKVRPVVCGSCGHLRLFVEPKALERLATSKHWQRV